jgi:MFS family permease
MTEPKTEAGPADGTSLGLVFLIVFIDLLGFAIVLPLMPRYAEKLHASPGQIGLLFASFSLMQFLFAPLWGRLSDRIGRRPVLLCGLLGSVVFYALFGVATMRQQLWLMFVARIGAGIAGATISTAQAYIADSTGAEGRAKGMSLIGAAFGAGFTFGPILGSIAMPGKSEGNLNSLPGFLAAGLSFFALALAWFKLPESLRKGLAPAKRSWLNLSALNSALSIPTVGLLLLLFFITTLAFAQFESTLSLLTEHAFKLDDDRLFYIFTYIGVMLSLMQGLVVRRLAPVLREGRMIIIGSVMLCAGLWLIGVAADKTSIKMLVAVIPLLVAGFSFVTPSAQALISRRSDPARQGEIMGLNQSASALARILGPVCGFKLIAHGITLPYQVAAGMVVPAILLAFFTASRGRDWAE